MASILPPAERRSVVLVATYTALSLLLLVIGDHLPVAWTRGVGAYLFEPFDRVVLTGDRLFAAWRESNELHRRITQLELDNQRLRSEGAENRRLRALLELPEWHGLPLRPVEVLALGGDPMPTSATLSAGARAGVRPGDALVTADGLVGRVTEVWPRLSRAALLTDPNLAIACEVESTGVNGILRFTLAPSPRLLMTAVPLSDTVTIGQRIVTSELSLRFPRGIPVGRVVRLHRDASGLVQEVEVAPSAQLSRLRHAFVAPGPEPLAPGEPLRPRLAPEPGRITPLPAARAAAAGRQARLATEAAARRVAARDSALAAQRAAAAARADSLRRAGR
ncbi:MAG: rod shape-determining protein MreC [Candidatus Eisenbacteria bacterium]|nr:rod shape-determining protein MreC [Candidatus Eisenbacteria bacterium]